LKFCNFDENIYHTIWNEDTMRFELTGKVIEIFDAMQVTERFRKREFVLETKEVGGNGMEFVETIKFQMMQDRCDLLNDVSVNDDATVSFSISGRRWEKDGNVNYFNNLNAWKIETAASQDAANNFADVPPVSDQDIPADSDDDEIPF